ncbi:hypothetical protein [Actinomycetospora sp. TBRC 11914]|uniref:hypothetical protein n=1 Tax=Actinomycetospora sp. TBRC 11914 TaxID=2729387 RepID=UPI00145FB851|nr:hypothetical protein [Actinomycetospora sp. TBRC 11914]NMO94077.1 hypothetical protein [Actinomycetospora sp. TBRC 11914]
MSSEDRMDLAAPPRSVRVRRYDTFAVLRRAQEVLGRAEVALDIARETVLHTRQKRARANPPRTLDDLTRLTLHLSLDRTPGER